jgi:hypothetical protein
MPTLFVTCRSCGTEFPTRIGEPTSGPSGVIISGLLLKCPKCGKPDQYSTADFHVPAGMEGPPPEGTSTAAPSPAEEHSAKNSEAQEKYAGFGVVPPENRSTHPS